MATDKGLLAGNTTMLILKLLEDEDMYGYQMIDTLAKRADNTFNLKAGTLYPILHSLEQKELVTSYEDNADGARVRKYYHLSRKGRKHLIDQQEQWTAYANAVNQVLGKGGSYAIV